MIGCQLEDLALITATTWKTLFCLSWFIEEASDKSAMKKKSIFSPKLAHLSQDMGFDFILSAVIYNHIIEGMIYFFFVLPNDLFLKFLQSTVASLSGITVASLSGSGEKKEQQIFLQLQCKHAATFLMCAPSQAARGPEKKSCGQHAGADEACNATSLFFSH